ncbi:MAG: TerC family protein, partial [Bdellovibrionota bacterium]
MGTPLWIWALFHLFIFLMLALDLGVFHREKHEVHWREALVWSVVWISLSLLFNLGIYFWRGKEVALSFTAGYLIEKSLSVDNLFVFLMIFTYFRVPKAYQHKVLFWGILSALILRGAFIFAGIGLISKFHWVMYVFGGFLVFTGFRMAFQRERELHPENNLLLKILARVVTIEKLYAEDRFFIRQGGRLAATPLLVALLVLETSDLLFAMDSIPAVIAVTPDPFIVYTSNVFAILGLRSLYFLLSGGISKFHYLKYALGAILLFVGSKMLLQEWIEISTGVSLAVIAALILGCVGISLVLP